MNNLGRARSAVGWVTTSCKVYDVAGNVTTLTFVLVGG